MFTRISLAILLVVIALTIALTGCGGQQSAIVGTWERVTSDTTVGFSFFGFAKQIEFLKDGTFVIPTFNNQSGKYSFPESDRIKFEGSAGSAVYKFTISGSTLTFEESGKIVEYRRIK